MRSSRWFTRIALLGAALLPGCAESAAPRDEVLAETQELGASVSLGWFEKQKLVVENGTNFGSAVAMSGTNALVANGQAGVYAYSRLENEWGNRQDLGIVGAENPYSQVGISVAISGDTALVGTPHTDEGGAVHVFARTGPTWTQEARLVMDDPVSPYELFGAAVGIDGDLAIIGAPTHESAYVFERVGNAWFQRKELRPGDALGQVMSFGAAVGISGNLVVVGAPLDGVEPEILIRAGKVYAYEKPSDPSGDWHEHVLVANPRQSGDFFGQSVAVSGDTIFVGAPVQARSAYAFTKLDSTWSAQVLSSDVATDQGGSQFGSSVAISGNSAVVGDPNASVRPRFYPGAAFVFTRVETGWIHEQTLINTTNFEAFGAAVGVSDDTIIVGAPGASFGGAMYVERLSVASGSPCAGDAVCGRGHCVEGICCEEACEGACEECSTGTCRIAPSKSPGSPTCSPYFCDGATRECPGRCLTHDDCTATHYCRDGACARKARLGEVCSGSVECRSEHCLARKCSGRLPNGDACENASECERGNCVDGVCCNDACLGQCEACDVAGQEGRCTVVTGAPHGARAPCAGTDATCKGRCDGRVTEACSYEPGSTTCDTACENGIETVSVCDGLGACVPGDDHSCVDFVCDRDAQACKLECESDEDCADGRSCWEDGACEPSPQCTDDYRQSETAPGGILRNCAPYVCGTDGACMTRCASPSDCAESNLCGPEQRCVPLASGDGGCGCRTAPSARAEVWQISLILLALARRARRRAIASGRAR